MVLLGGGGAVGGVEAGEAVNLPFRSLAPTPPLGIAKDESLNPAPADSGRAPKG